MTISGKDETIIRSTASLSTDCSATVPLKKRKFLFNRSPSPPSDENLANSPENDLPCPQLNSLSQVSAISGTVSIGKSTSSQYDGKRNTACLGKRSFDAANAPITQTIGDKTEVKGAQPGLSNQSCHCEDTEKLLNTRDSVAEGSMKTESKVVSLAANPLKNDLAGCEERRIERDHLSRIAIAGNSDLLRRPVVLNNYQERSGKNLDNEGDLSLDLSLCKGGSGTQPKNHDSGCMGSAVSDNVKRLSWDLNTTMDAWEGAPCGNTAGPMNSASLNVIDGSHDVTLSIRTNGSASTSVSERREKGKVGLHGSEGTLPAQLNIPHNSDCSLSLGLSPSSLLKKSSNLSNVAIGQGSLAPFASCSKTMGPENIKSEPHDETLNPNASGTLESRASIIKGAAGLKDSQVKCVDSGAPNTRFPGVVGPKLIKREPTEGSVSGAIRTENRISKLPAKMMPQSHDNQEISFAKRDWSVEQMQHPMNMEIKTPSVAEVTLSPAGITENYSSIAANRERCQITKHNDGEIASEKCGKNEGCTDDNSKTAVYGAVDKNSESSIQWDDQMPSDGSLARTMSTPNQLIDHKGSEFPAISAVDSSREMSKSSECQMNVIETGNSEAPHDACRDVKQVDLGIMSLPIGHKDGECNMSTGFGPTVFEGKEAHISNGSREQLPQADGTQETKTAGLDQLVKLAQNWNDRGCNTNPISAGALSVFLPSSVGCDMHVNESENVVAVSANASQDLKQVRQDKISSDVSDGNDGCDIAICLPSGVCGRTAGSQDDGNKSCLLDSIPELDLNGPDYNLQNSTNLSAINKGSDDGEVQKPVIPNTSENLPMMGSRSEGVPDSDFVYRTVDNVYPTCSESSTSTHLVEENCSEPKAFGEISDVDTNACSQESMEKPVSELENVKHACQDEEKTPGVQGEDGISKAKEDEQFPDHETHTSQGSLVTASLGYSGDKKSTDVGANNTSASNKEDISSCVDDQLLDTSARASQSRTINLALNSNKSLADGIPFTSESIEHRQIGREARSFQTRGRNESSFDCSQKFPREGLGQGHRDRFPRNPYFGPMYNKRRISSRIDPTQRNRGFEREFASRFSGSQREFGVYRNKYEPNFEELAFDGYVDSCQDDGHVSGDRRQRRLSGDETSYISHMPSRRRSPEWRHIPPDGVLPFMRKGPRNFGRGRYAGEVTTSFREYRYREKFCRAPPHDNTDPIFRRHRPSYEDPQSDFVHRNNNFYSVQARDRQKIRSRSPVRLSAHSPDICSPYRNRPLDGFNDHTGFNHRRSHYHMEMMRSPDARFSRDMIIHRHGSPTFLSRPTRDMDSMKGYSRSALTVHNQPDRVPFRNRGKFSGVNPEERDECDFFGRPMCSGRFNELSFDGNIEERRSFGERCDTIHSHHHLDDNCSNINSEGGPETSQFSEINEVSEQDSLRQFDRQVKNIAGKVEERRLEDQV